MLHLGAFVTESSGHFSEYAPYFRKRPDLLQRYTRADYLGQSGFYANNWPAWRRANDELIAAMLSGDRPIPRERGHEYGSFIIEAIEGGPTTSIHGNVRNEGWIDNLSDGCVEVECRVDRAGIHPQRFGPLPEQLAALNRAHMAVHELVVEALMKRDRSKAKLALMLDPLTAAVCSLEEIDRLFEEMWTAERESLQAFES
jgi:alpha-galactosidase